MPLDEASTAPPVGDQLRVHAIVVLDAGAYTVDHGTLCVVPVS
jgi:hypothetical protein